MTATLLAELIPAANGRQIGVLTLNAEKSLNALSLDMIRAMHPALKAWRDDPNVACVVMQGAGEKAFCAGGDVVSLYKAIQAGNLAHCDTFFAEEYELDIELHTYPKPILCWGHGIVMGGGKGLLVGASHRVVTEKSRFAMPEITIGLFPDVGGSWFLNRLPGKLGVFLGLTGVSFNAADALFIGMADYALPAEHRSVLLHELAAQDWQAEPAANHRIMSRYLRETSRAKPAVLPEAQIRNHYDAIQALCDCDSVPELVAALTRYSGEDEWLKSGAQKLAAGSMVSAWLIVETQRRARHLSLEQVFAMELNVARQCCRQHDLAEGVRALLVDKDNAPNWSYRDAADVPAALIEAHFRAP